MKTVLVQWQCDSSGCGMGLSDAIPENGAIPRGAPEGWTEFNINGLALHLCDGCVKEHIERKTALGQLAELARAGGRRC